MAGQSTLHNRRLQDKAILMYKVKKNLCPTYISTLFEQPAIKYKLRNHDFTLPRFITISFGKHSLRYMGPKAWSSSFKCNIRKVDLSMLLDDNNCNILLSLHFLIFCKITDTFVHIVYSSPEFPIRINPIKKGQEVR